MLHCAPLPLRGRDGRFLPNYVSDPFDPRGWEEDLPYRRLDLTRDQFCIVDHEDYDWACRHLWICTLPKDRKAYAMRTTGSGWQRAGIFLHKAILERMGPPPSDAHTIGDHKNGDSLDNRRRNLRWATVQENCDNKHGWYYKQLQMEL